MWDVPIPGSAGADVARQRPDEFPLAKPGVTGGRPA